MIRIFRNFPPSHQTVDTNPSSRKDLRTPLFTTMAKTRVATRVKAAVGGKKSYNESQDLVNLTEKYNAFVKRLQGLIAALKEHYGAMQTIAKTRYTVRRTYVCARTRRVTAEARQDTTHITFCATEVATLQFKMTD